MDALCTAFLHSVPDSIKTNPKKLSRKLKEHFVQRTFYFKKTYFLEAVPNNYVPLTQEMLIQEVQLRGLLYAPKIAKKHSLKYSPKSQSPAQIEKEQKVAAHKLIIEFLSAVRETHHVDWVGDLAGHFPGPAVVNHVPSLILHGPAFIKPKEGDHLPVYNVIKSLLKEAPESPTTGDPIQEDYFLPCLQRCRRLLLEGRYEPMQILMFAGTHDDGKTLLATEIISPTLGDRRVDASAFLTGDTRFNADLVKSELWLMDDHNESKWYDRRILESALKKISANPDVRAEPKGVDAINARDLFRVVVCLFNIEGAGGAHLIPPLSEDFKGKVQIFHTRPADLPVGSKQFLEIRKLIRPHIPAFLYWLDNIYQPKAEVLSGSRYQIHAYHNPDVCAQIDELSPATRLRPLLESWLKEAGQEERIGNPTELFKDLSRDDGVFKTLTQICKNEISLGRALAELCRRYPDQYFNLGKKGHPRYRILTETKAEQLSKAISSATSTAPTGTVVVEAKFKT